MGRSAQIIRTGALVSLLVLASPGWISTAEGMKGIRALVFSGEAIGEPVRISDSEAATAMWLGLRGGPVLPDDSLAVLKGRRCVIISAFIFNDRNENVPVDELPAGRGDYVYHMYLLGPGVRPRMIAGSRFWKLNAAIAEDLAALGVPIADTTRATAGCK